MTYSVDGEDFPLELLTEADANDVLRTLQAQADVDPAAAETRALTTQIADVRAWLSHLADEATEIRTADAAAEHAADLYADHHAGVH